MIAVAFALVVVALEIVAVVAIMSPLGDKVWGPIADIRQDD